MTDIETWVAKTIDAVSIAYIREKRIDSFSVDFVIEKLNVAIEVDGGYFHDRLHEKEPRRAESEDRKNQEIARAGYKLVRISGPKLKSFPNTANGKRDRMKFILDSIYTAAGSRH